VVTLAEAPNESSAVSGYVLPIHHAFESWGDHKTRTGLCSFQQPVISPLYNTRQKESILQMWTAGNPDGYKDPMYHEYIMDRWEKEVFPSLKLKVDFKSFWLSSLHDGVMTFNESPTLPARVKSDAASMISTAAPSDGFVLYLHDSYFIGDGRFANNGWLQEMPHVASKVTWDNYASLSPSTAKELQVKEGDMVRVTVENRSLSLPVHVQPGLAEKFVSVMLGYGRTVIGTVGAGAGFNATLLMSKSSRFSPWLYPDVQVAKTGETYLLASTEEHHAVDDSFLKDAHKIREIVQEGTVVQYIEDPKFIERERYNSTIVPKVKYEGVKWAMAIDLNKCTGCNVCTIACTVENNVPIVGKVQVDKGRDMAWIRIDRYFSGTPENPSVSNQPMLCQQCDNAPCENVCPVSATSHSPDGLNQMAYNRCVGTKYCANNCPYKVRRFNFINFRDDFDDAYQYEEPLNMAYNPEVTVRSRGVMEKCTFCIQRIMEARQHAIEQNRPLKGSDVVTACQQACPAEAIIFGDMNDKDSTVSKYRNHEIGYRVLEEINVGPNITYIAKLRNVTSQMEKS
ncbi:MAG: 4Fe-4S dicluster domain-containing protein, partial [Bacteroidota bacterium]|nr:4Fe-4S dicluster domain-containing protein [Bacteroidota bacterium]